MGRWTQYDEDAYRLPAGVVRTGYDADTGQYYFSDRTTSRTWAGEPGSYYGPMYPVGTTPKAPSTVAVEPTRLLTEDGPRRSGRRATLANVHVPDAFRRLRRSLTTARVPWRRQQSPPNDLDEEPVAVSRPSSWPPTPPPKSPSHITPTKPPPTQTLPASSTPAGLRKAVTLASRSASTSTAEAPRFQANSRRAASEHIHSTPSRAGKHTSPPSAVTSPVTTETPAQRPPSPSLRYRQGYGLSVDTTTATASTKLAIHSRSASVSDTRAPQSQVHSRRTVSKHIRSSSGSAVAVEKQKQSTSHPVAVTSPVETGTAAPPPSKKRASSTMVTSSTKSPESPPASTSSPTAAHALRSRRAASENIPSSSKRAETTLVVEQRRGSLSPGQESESAAAARVTPL